MSNVPNLGNNITGEIADGKLILTIDLNVSGTDSKSKKSVIFASTGGNKTIAVNDEEYKLGLNFFKVKPKE